MNALMIAMLVIGLIILCITLRSWARVKNSVHGHRQEKSIRAFKLPEVIMPSGLFTEWLSYVRGEHHEKQLRSLIISGAFFAVVIAFNQRWFQFNWIITVFAALIILFIAQLKYGRMQHYAQFEKSFPEAIALVSTAVASGHSMHHAIERCGRELDGVLGTEFNRISRRLNLGELPQAVFSDAWQRFRYPEFYFFSIVALLSMQRGGQITELIKRLGRTMAANKAMQRRKAAMTAESRFTVKLLAAVPVLVMMGMKMLAPENFDFLLADNGGRLILWYVAISELSGLFIVWWLIRRAT